MRGMTSAAAAFFKREVATQPVAAPVTERLGKVLCNREVVEVVVERTWTKVRKTEVVAVELASACEGVEVARISSNVIRVRRPAAAGAM